MSTRRQVWIAFGSVLLLGGIIFRHFIFGDQLLLYKDMGSDSINDSYPFFVHLSDYIRAQGMPSWSFYVGMGQSLFYRSGDLLWNPVVWLPRTWIAHALVYQHCAKILIAAVLWFRFLQFRGAEPAAALLATLLVCFSSYATMGACWYQNVDELVCFSAVLLGAEIMIQHRNWLWLTLGVMLTGFVSAFHLYLAALLLVAYVPVRLIELHGWSPKILTSVCSRGAAVALLGVGLSAIVSLGNAETMLHSARGSGEIGSFGWPSVPSIFHIESPHYYWMVISRLFNNDLLGTGDSFRGWPNYFEAPALYCGVISILSLPQFLWRNPRGRFYLALIGLVSIPIVFPWARYALWLFAGGYYRAYALFLVFGIIMMSATAWSNYLVQRSLSPWILLATVAASIGFLYLPDIGWNEFVDVDLRYEVIAFVSVYAIVLFLGRYYRIERAAVYLVILLTAAELVIFNHRTVDNRPILAKHELFNGIAYHDETVEAALHDIKADHDAGFFRLTKTWSSGPSPYPSYNDAMVFRYYGTAAYNSFNSINYINFLRAVDAPNGIPIGRFAQLSLGLLGQPLVETFACEKYVLTSDPALLQRSGPYVFLRSYGSKTLLRNPAGLPFGLVYNDVLDENVFKALSVEARRDALLHVAVAKRVDRSPWSGPWVDPGELQTLLHNTNIYAAIEQRLRSATNLREFNETHFETTYETPKPGIVVFQTPFDSGWRASVDGHHAESCKIDIGLLGVVVPAGAHSLAMSYRPPLLISGIIVTSISIIIFIIALRRLLTKTPKAA